MNWHTWLLASGCGFLVPPTIGLIGHYLVSSRQRLIVLATGAPYLMLFAVPALVCLALSDSAVGIVVAVLVAALCAVSQQILRVEPAPDAAAPRLRIMTINLLLSRADPAHVLELVRGERVDVLLVQELTRLGFDQLRAAGIDTLLPYYFVDAGWGGEGSGLWARYPLIDAEVLPGFGFGNLRARLRTPSAQHPMLYCIHLEPPWPRPPAAWVQELPRLADLLHAERAEHQVIVAGDFNATAGNAPFRRVLRNGYREARRSGIHLPLLTWPANRRTPCWIGIDHILLRGVRTHWIRTSKVRGSDHLAVLAELALAPPAGSQLSGPEKLS